MSSPSQRQPFVIDFGEAFQRYIDSHQKVWVHDRSTTVGASEAFSCLRQVWFEKRHKEFKIKPDDDFTQSWGAMERGNLIEEHYVAPALQEQLPAIGINLEFAGSEQETLVKGRNSATPDGLIVDIPEGPVTIKSGEVEIYIPWVSTGCIGLEIKSIDPRATLEEEKSKHHGQSQVGMGLTREITDWKPEYWVILYVDASFVDNLTPFVVEYDPAIYEAAKKRAHDVWAINDPMQIVPEGRLDKSCDHCKWKTACTAAILSAYAKTQEDYEPEDITALEPLAKHYLKLKKEKEAAELAYNTVAQQVKDKLLEINRRKVRSEDWTVTWSRVKGREYLDFAAMEADGVDLSKYKRQAQATERLLVTPRKTKGAPSRE